MQNHPRGNTGPTPGPYVAEQGGARGAWVKGSNSEWICLVCGDTDESARANIPVILTALNNHAELVQSLKAALMTMERAGMVGTDAYVRGAAALANARVQS